MARGGVYQKTSEVDDAVVTPSSPRTDRLLAAKENELVRANQLAAEIIGQRFARAI